MGLDRNDGHMAPEGATPLGGEGGLDRRSFVGKALVTAAAAAALPLATSAGASAGERKLLTASAARRRQVRQTVRLVIPGEVRGLDPHERSANGYPPSVRVINSCYESLFQNGYPLGSKAIQKLGAGAGDVQTLLAESSQWVDGGKTLRVKLRSNVKSSYGNELSANDVVWSISKSLAAKLAGQFQLGLAGITTADQIVAVDNKTVDFRLSAQNTLLPYVLSRGNGSIFDSTEAKKHATSDDPWASNWLKTNTAGYGPYIVSSFGSGGGVVQLKLRDDYWRAKTGDRGAYIPNIVIGNVPDGAQRVQFLLRGDADYTEQLTVSQYKSFDKSTGTGYSHIPSAQGLFFFLDYKNPPWNDPAIRRGLYQAIDTDTLIKTVYAGSPDVQKMKSFMAPFAKGWTDRFQIAYDPKAAAAALASVQGQTLSYMYNSDLEVHQQVALLLQSFFQKVGINAQPNGVPTATWNSQFRGGIVPNAVNNLDSPNFPTPYYYGRLYFTSAFVNPEGYKNGEMDTVVNSILTETDEKKLNVLIRRMQAIAMRDLPMLPLLWTGTWVAQRRGLTILQTDGANGTVVPVNMRWRQ